MNFTKKAYLLNKYRIETEGLEGAREATARAVEWDGHEVKNATPIAKGEEPIRPHDQKDVLLVSPVGLTVLSRFFSTSTTSAESLLSLSASCQSFSAGITGLSTEKSFQKNHYVSSEDQEDLAKSLGIKKEQVSVWLHNRISREKRTLLKDKNADSLDPSNRPSKSSATPKSNQYKKKLERFSPTAKDILNKSYEKSEWLTIEMTTSLVEKTGLSRRQVQIDCTDTTDDFLT
jgi:hypothetical protein